MDLHPVDIIINIISIIVLFLLLRLLIYKPVRRFMDEREKKIQDRIFKADQNRQESERLKQQYETSLAGAKEQISLVAQEEREKTEREAAAILAEARQKAAAIEEQARKAAEEERRKAMRSLNEDITNLAVDMARRILRREVRLEDNRALVDDFLRKAGEAHAGSNSENRASL